MARNSKIRTRSQPGSTGEAAAPTSRTSRAEPERRLRGGAGARGDRGGAARHLGLLRRGFEPVFSVAAREAPLPVSQGRSSAAEESVRAGRRRGAAKPLIQPAPSAWIPERPDPDQGRSVPCSGRHRYGLSTTFKTPPRGAALVGAMLKDSDWSAHHHLPPAARPSRPASALLSGFATQAAGPVENAAARRAAQNRWRSNRPPRRAGVMRGRPRGSWSPVFEAMLANATAPCARPSSASCRLENCSRPSIIHLRRVRGAAATRCTGPDRRAWHRERRGGAVHQPRGRGAPEQLALGHAGRRALRWSSSCSTRNNEQIRNLGACFAQEIPYPPPSDQLLTNFARQAVIARTRGYWRGWR